MRILKAAAAIAVALAAMSVPAGSVSAQSFLQQLFQGFAATPPPPPPQHGNTRVVAQDPQSNKIKPAITYRSRQSLDYTSPADLRNARRPTGSYKTVCVRMCDGFYWPISSSTRRSGFHRDALTCTSSCDSEARLFYLPRNARTVKGMRDLTGRVYDSTENAYLYRKKLVDGCTCKPAPWTRTERSRHARYAWAAEMQKIEAKARADMAAAELVAGAGKKSAEVVAGAATREPQLAEVDPQGLDILNEDPETLTVLTSTNRFVTALPGNLATIDPAHGDSFAAVVPPTTLASMTPIQDHSYTRQSDSKSALRSRKKSWSKKPLADSKKKKKKRKKKGGSKKYASSKPKPKPSSGFAGLFGGPNKKYKWPGDK